MSIAINDSTDLITATNNGIDIFFQGNTGHPQHHSLNDFWCSHNAVNGSPMPDCSGGLTDPQVQFDPVNYRWIVTTLTVDQLYLYIAASTYDDGYTGPSGWYRYYENACGQSGTPTLLGDEPHLGIINGRAFVDVRYCGTGGNANPDTIWEFKLGTMEKGQNFDPAVYPVQHPTVMNMRPVQNGGYGQYQWFAGEYTDSAGAHVVIEYANTNSTSSALTYFTTLGVDSWATPGDLPDGPQPQAGCPGYVANCNVDRGFPIVDGLSLQNTHNSDIYLFGTFASNYGNNPNWINPPNSVVELFGINLSNQTWTSQQDATCPNPAYPSVVFNNTSALYLHYATFWPTAYPSVCNNLYYYYPIGSMYEYGSDTPTASTATFYSAYQPYPFNSQRWGDFSGSNWVKNYSVNSWPANIWELDEFTNTGADQSTMISGWVPPNF